MEFQYLLKEKNLIHKVFQYITHTSFYLLQDNSCTKVNKNLKLYKQFFNPFYDSLKKIVIKEFSYITLYFSLLFFQIGMNYLPQNVYPVDSLLKLEIDGSRLLIIIITVNVSIAQ